MTTQTQTLILGCWAIALMAACLLVAVVGHVAKLPKGDVGQGFFYVFLLGGASGLGIYMWVLN